MTVKIQYIKGCQMITQGTRQTRNIGTKARALDLRWLWGFLLLTLLTVAVTVSAQAAVPTVDPAGAYIEAEDYTAMGAPNPWAWEIQTGVTGYQGTGYLFTTNGGTGTQPNGSRVDFPVDFTAGGTYQIWLRSRDAAGAGGGDSTFWGIDGVVMGALTPAGDNVWQWTTQLQNGTNQASITLGNHTINLWPRENGQHTDSIFIIRTDQGLPAEISEGSISGAPSGFPALDFSGAGPGAGEINIPDGQQVNGNPVDLVNGTATSPDEIEYSTGLGSLTYRAMGGESDGFNSFSVDSKWTKTDVGGDTTPAPSIVNGVLNLTGSGQNIWGTSDFFSYLYQSGISGDFTIDVHVKSLMNTAGFAKAGIMVRQTLAANSQHAMALITRSNGAGFYRRLTSGATSQNTLAAGVVTPEWVRIVRSGDTFTGYYSEDGSTWNLIGNATVNMTDPVIIGLAVTSANAAQDNTAEFDNFMFMPAGTSGMTDAWTSVSTSIDTDGPGTAWTDGDYGISIKSGSTFGTNTFTYNSCVDATTSSITIPASQTISGTSVSLPALYSTGGNVGTFSYQINGQTVNSPWNSMGYGTGPTAEVTLKVTGIDPDCGGSVVSASQTITVDNTCNDPTPSTITVLTGQSSGGTVDLTSLYTTTGNVGSFTYKINGVPYAGDPTSYDSTGHGTSSPESVTFEVSGSDTDCGNMITAVNAVEFDNTCIRNPPSISFDKDTNYVGAGRVVPYTVTIRNEDSFNCSPTTFDVDITSDPVNGDFVASDFNPVGSNTGIMLNGRASTTIELAVEATAGASEWVSKNTTLTITSIEDPDGAHNSPKTTGTVTTNVFLVSPITHNSVTTGSTKWGGKWGTSETGSKYGNFDCLTCHEKGGPNIKWMKGTIDMPALSPDATWGTSGLASLPITFQDARDGSGDWGNDDYTNADGYDPAPAGIGRTGSVSPCEVCHSITMYHRYDTEADPDAGGPLTKQTTYNHFPDRDCTDCHRHSLGFTASCDGCHGNPPLEATIGGPNGLADIPAQTGSTTPGTHYKHVVVLEYPCEYCHNGYRSPGEMPGEIGGKQDINHEFKVFDSSEPAATAGNYTGQDGVSYGSGSWLPTAGQGTMTCENIYCHGGTDNMGGSNPQWNGNITCNSCHGTSASNTPPGYSHTTHVGQMGQACTICHGSTPTPGSNGHVNGSVKWDLTDAPNTGSLATYNGSTTGESGTLAPSAVYGTCSNVSCHYGRTTPVWNSGPATCTICHYNGTDDGALVNSAPNTGSHSNHMDPSSAMVNGFINKCESCHGAGSNTSEHGGHVNFVTDFAVGFTYNDAPVSNCTNNCHEGDYVNDLWGSADPLNCDACHKSPYLGPTVVDPLNAGAGMAASGYGSHLKETKGENLSLVADWSAQCKKCHPYHVSGSGVVDIPLPPAEWDGAAVASGTSSPLMGPGSNMQEKLGLQFPITGAIHLGGTATVTASWYYDSANPSEAEMCWGCHGLDTELNEWGYNADTSGSFPVVDIGHLATSASGHTDWAGPGGAGSEGSFNYGYLYSDSGWTSGNATSKWVDNNGRGMYRRDAYQHDAANSRVMSRRISSVHSVDFSMTPDPGSSVAQNIHTDGKVKRDNSGTYLQTLETVDKIRCSYCHDVHDLNRAQVSAGVNETSTGRPYLRGTWMGNPYPPDMPPLNSYSYSTNTGPTQNGTKYGNRYYASQAQSPPFQVPVPRLFASDSSHDKGGFFIDLNSGQPTTNASFDTQAETGGICALCHGDDVDTLDYYTSDSMWRFGSGKNGHANSVLGGTGAGATQASNLFDATRGDSNNHMAHQNGLGAAKEGGQNNPLNWDTGGASGPFQTDMKKAMNQNPPQQAPKVTGWYGGTAGDMVTWAGRPAQYDTWYSAGGIGHDGSGSGRAHSFTCSKCHSPHAAGLPALVIHNCLDKDASDWVATNRTSANPSAPQATNCHRKDTGTTTTSGWHRLAPTE